MWHLVGPMIGVIVCGVAAVWLYLPDAMQAAALDAAFRSNIEVAEQIKITRGYYTQNVVAKATASGALTPSAHHVGDPGAIPLPATFVQDISALLARKDTTLSLVSPYPWPHRADREMDPFQRQAWDAFQADPQAVISRTELRGGRRVLRVAVPDRMTTEACVACHNSDLHSPRVGWQLGDVRAVMEVTRVIEPYLAAAEGRSRTILFAIAGIAVVVIIVMMAIATVVARSVRGKQEVDQHVLFLAHHDAMTGALNRSRFVSLLRERTVQSPKAPRTPDIALLYVDVDRFKEVNDRFGHATGDMLIEAVVARLRTLLRHDDLIGRVGGDEFVIARLREVDEPRALQLGGAIVAELERPFLLANHTVNVSASVGVRVGTGPIEDLLRAADIALYRAKSSGRNQAVLFSKDMQDELAIRRDLETTIRDSSLYNRFDLYFQPIHDGADRRLHGFEALLRLPLPGGGFVPPSECIRIAEEIGTIGAIGAWVLNQACLAAARWPDHLSVSVNLSALQFAPSPAGDGLIVDIVRSALATSGLSPHRLALEITETVLMEKTDDVIGQLHGLKALGVTLVLDDFGTGYSSLSYLWKLPFERVKIDRSFVAALNEQSQSAAQIIATILALSHSLGMRVTGEGVENEEQARFLANLHCDQLQGFLFGRAMPQTELAGYMLEWFIAEHLADHLSLSAESPVAAIA
ncbi:putative bifunctional diguanylate cyclase/phosphodiesterase [Phreatobacter aquaticus]|uniref:putative bifunctional diguanylate cyclase/phosphodiesterase n=1 Tax=Phreatobacter aquaticus TaxID=2570229 RepID=UPI00143D441C|nr:EAL domain-containing protein [Phreatobacter aquaticus]